MTRKTVDASLCLNPPLKTRRLSLLAPVLLGAVVSVGAKPGEVVIHAAERGDTLSEISANYLGDAERWPVLRKLNRIADDRKIPVGAQIRVPVDAMRWQAEEVRVIRIEGSATVVRVGGTKIMPLKRDDVLLEGDALRMGPGSFAALALADGSIVNVQADTVVRMNNLRKVSATGAQRAILGLEKGGVDAIVKPMTPSGRFDVSTPLAVAGVRGTRFSVRVNDEGETTIDVLAGAVNFAGVDRARVMHVGSGMGAVVGSSGEAGLPRPLADPPDLSSVLPMFERPAVTVALAGLPAGTTVKAQVARSADMRDVIRSQQSTDAPIQFRDLSDGVYFLGVQVADAHGVMSRQSIVPFRLWSTPEPPVPVSPSAGAMVPPSGLTVECSAVEGATVYDLELSASPSFERLVAQSIGAPACRWELPQLDAGTYYWRATTVVRNEKGEMVRGPRGDARDFIVAAEVRDQPVQMPASAR